MVIACNLGGLLGVGHRFTSLLVNLYLKPRVRKSRYAFSRFFSAGAFFGVFCEFRGLERFFVLICVHLRNLRNLRMKNILSFFVVKKLEVFREFKLVIVN